MTNLKLIVVIGFIAVAAIAGITVEIVTDQPTKYDNRDKIQVLQQEAMELRVEVAVLSGIIQGYEQLWLAQEARIGILENRYDQLSILENSVTNEE